MNAKGLFAELKQRRVYRAVAVYAVAVFGLWQAADIAIPALSLPQDLMRYIVGGALLGFPFVLILSWLYDLSVTRTELSADSHPARMVRPTVLAILAFLALVIAGGLTYRKYESGVSDRAAVGDPRVSFELGVEHYFAGNRSEAAKALEVVAANTTLPAERRQEALRYLVRSYSEAEDTVRARAVMRRLLSLEPPLALMLPGVETDPVMEIYYEARREKMARAPGGAASTPGVIEVLTFIPLGDAPEELAPEEWQTIGTGVGQFLLTDLSELSRGRVRFVDRWSVAERGYDVYRFLESPEAGRLARPTHLLIGSVAARRGQILLTAWLIDAGLGTLTHSHQVTGTFDEFYDLVTRLSTELARSMDVG